MIDYIGNCIVLFIAYAISVFAFGLKWWQGFIIQGLVMIGCIWGFYRGIKAE